MPMAQEPHFFSSHSSEEDDTVRIMEGQLKKRTVFKFKRWRSNHYRLSRNKLCLFKNARDLVPSKVYLLPTTTLDNPIVSSSKVYSNCFLVHTCAGKVLTLQASNSVEQKAWIKAISEATREIEDVLGGRRRLSSSIFVGREENIEATMTSISDAHAIAMQEEAQMRGEWEEMKPAMEMKAQTQLKYCEILDGELKKLTAKALLQEKIERKNDTNRKSPPPPPPEEQLPSSPMHFVGDDKIDFGTIERVNSLKRQASFASSIYEDDRRVIEESDDYDSESSMSEEEDSGSPSARSLWKHAENLRRDLLRARVAYDKCRVQIMFPATDGFLCFFGSSVHMGFRDFYLESLKCDYTVKLEPPGRAFLKLSGVCCLRLEGVHIRGERGTRVPRKDYSYLEMEVHYVCTLPFRYVSMEEVAQRMKERGEEGSPNAYWEAGEGYSLSIVKLERLRGTKMPTFTLRSMFNMVLQQDSMRDFISSMFASELGELLRRCTRGKVGLAIAVEGTFSMQGPKLEVFRSALQEPAAMELLGLSDPMLVAVMQRVASEIVGQTEGSGRPLRRLEIFKLINYFTRFAKASNWIVLRKLWQRKLDLELAEDIVSQTGKEEKEKPKFPFDKVLLQLQCVARKQVQVKLRVDNFFFTGGAGAMMRCYKSLSLRWCRERHDPNRLAQLAVGDRPIHSRSEEVAEIHKKFARRKRFLRWLRRDLLRNASFSILTELTGGPTGRLQTRFAGVRLKTAVTDLALELKLLDLRVRTLSLLAACRASVNESSSSLRGSNESSSSSRSLIKSAIQKGIPRKRRMTIAEKWAEARLVALENALREGAKLDMRVVIDGAGRMAFETGHCALNSGRALAGLRGELHDLRFGAAALPLVQDLLGRGKSSDVYDTNHRPKRNGHSPNNETDEKDGANKIGQFMNALNKAIPEKTDILDEVAAKAEKERKEVAEAEFRSYANQVVDMLEKYVCSAEVMSFRMQLMPSLTVHRGQLQLGLEPADLERLNAKGNDVTNFENREKSFHPRSTGRRGQLSRYRNDSFNAASGLTPEFDLNDGLCVKCRKEAAVTQEEYETKLFEACPEYKSLARRVECFYVEYNPARLIEQPNFIRDILKQYKGYEDLLIEQLVQKYGPEPMMEGFVCPVCHLKLNSAAALTQHYTKEHAPLPDTSPKSNAPCSDGDDDSDIKVEEKIQDVVDETILVTPKRSGSRKSFTDRLPKLNLAGEREREASWPKSTPIISPAISPAVRRAAAAAGSMRSMSASPSRDRASMKGAVHRRVHSMGTSPSLERAEKIASPRQSKMHEKLLKEREVKVDSVGKSSNPPPTPPPPRQRMIDSDRKRSHSSSRKTSIGEEAPDSPWMWHEVGVDSEVDSAIVSFSNQVSCLDLLEDVGLTLAPRRPFLPRFISANIRFNF